MADKIPEPRPKALLFSVIEVALVAEKNHLVFRKDGLNRRDDCIGQVTGEMDIVDVRSDPPGQRSRWAAMDCER
jgi:hypothetical protein